MKSKVVNPEVTNLGRIKLIGGENEILNDEITKGIIIQHIPKSTASSKEIAKFERFIKENEISKEFLKEVSDELRDSVKEFKVAKQTATILSRYISQFISTEKVMERIENIIKNHDGEVDSKLNCLKLLQRRRKISMMRPKMTSEIKKGDKVVVKEFTNKFGAKDFYVTFYRPFETNDGGLKNKDLMALYFSRRIGFIKKVIEDGEVRYKLLPLVEQTDIHREEIIIPFIRDKMKYPGVLYVRINGLVPIQQISRKVFYLRDRSKDEISFLLNLKGDAIRVGECSYYDKDALEKNPAKENNWINLKALSYNMLDYEKNHVVIIGRKPTLTHIEKRVEKLHEEFEEKYKRDPELCGLTKHEETTLKKIKRKKGSFDFSEIRELLEIFQERNLEGKLIIKGSQSQLNIEHDIRNHHVAKYILGNKNSDELFFLKKALEEIAHVDDIEVLSLEYINPHNYEEVKNYSKKLNGKKLNALISVVTSFHLRYEYEEDLGKYLTDELKEIDKVSHDRDDKSYKTHRNYYSQTNGVLAPNGNPQETHRRNNPPNMDTIRRYRKQNRNVLVGKYAGVSDPHILCNEVYTNPPSLPFYPGEIQRALGVKGKLQSRDVIDATFEELKFYLPKEIRIEYWTLQEEKYPAPQFKVPDKKVEDYYDKCMCRICPHESKCLTQKIAHFNKRMSIINYSKKNLGLDIDDPELIQAVYEEIYGYLPYNRRMLKDKEIKIYIPKAKAVKMGMIEEDSSSSPYSMLEFHEYYERKKGKEAWNKKYPDINTVFLKEFPGTLFYAKGDVSLLDCEKISIAGGRQISTATENYIIDTIDKVSDEYVVVAGLAKGCDTIAHQRTLDNDGLTIAVLPCGLNHIYPPENKKLADDILEEGGLLLSMYRPDSIVSKRNLVNRNRIISGLASDTVIICEGGNGTAHTENFAKQQGKRVVYQSNIQRY